MKTTASPSKFINLVIADKNKIYLEMLDLAFRECQDIVVHGVCQSLNDLKGLLNKSDVDILLIDDVIFDRSPEDGFAEIKVLYPDLKIVAISIQESKVKEEMMKEIGVDEYLSKLNGTEKLFNVIRNN